MNSHDPDFPKEIPAIPDAETTPPPEQVELGAVEDSDTCQGRSTSEASPDLDPSVMDAPLADASAMAASGREPSTPESPTPELSTLDPSAPVMPTSATPRPAAEVWTELDEATPSTGMERQPEGREPAPWPSGGSEKKGEPDPSVLDAGSGPRREAEKPGRAVPPHDDWEPSEVPYQPKELGVIDQLLIILAEGATIWRKILRQVRSWLPITWQRNLSDERMTAMALGLLILWLILWNPLAGGEAYPGGGGDAPEQSGPALAPRGDEGGSAPLGGSTLSPGGDASPPSTADIPTEPLGPSPNQSLIADIQERVSKISRSYAVGLIQSVEVNLPQQILAVNLSPDWYGLGAESQDSIAQDIYSQAQGVALAKLQLRDPDGLVVARNPVVGPTMVILKRHRPTEIP